MTCCSPHRDRLRRGRAGFAWPRLDEFNWALDWFDVIAAEHPDRLALRVVGDDGSDEAVSYAAMAARSAQVANWLRGLGVRRGDHVLLMLGNIVPLWEVMLAAMKLGAVVIPASTLLQPADLADRIAARPRAARDRRGGARAEVRRRPRRLDARGRRRVGPGAAEPMTTARWARPAGTAYADSAAAPAEFTPDGVTRADDPLLLYFTSGTTSQPKLVGHTHVSYPVGHLSTMYWIGIKPGDVHLNISSPGWAKHAWSNFFAPWNAQATILILNQARFSAAGLLTALGDCGVTTFCAPPTVWRMLIQADLSAADTSRAARVRRGRRAAQPGGHRAGPQGLGHHRPGRLRPDGDDRPGRQPARPAAQARVDGPPAARLPGRPRRPGHRRAAGLAERARDLPRPRPAARSA